MRLFILDRLRTWADTQVSRFEAEAETRNQDQDLEKLRPLSLRLLIALAAFTALFVAFSFAAPPGLLTERIEKLHHSYISIGQLCIMDGQKLSCKETHFPPSHTERLKPNLATTFEYQFDVLLRPEDDIRGLSSLLIPTIWGESEIYRNGNLISRGPNVFETLPLLSGLNRIRIVVKNDSGLPGGILGLFPPTVLSAADAFRLRDDVTNEPITQRLTLALQYMIVAILAMFWIWSKRQQELLFFLILAFTEVLKNTLFVLYFQEGITFLSPRVDLQIYEILRSLSIFLTVPFILATFRIPLREMSDMPKKYGWKYLAIVIFVAVGAMSLSNSISLPSARTLGFLVASTLFLFFISVPNLVPLFMKRLYSRLWLTSLTVGGVLVWYGRLAIDLFHLETGITTEYNNQLLFFIVMTGLLAFQFGKTESRYSSAKSLLSKETAKKIEANTAGANPEQFGFVVLVDIAGWTRMRHSIPEHAARNHYSKETLEALMREFDAQGYSIPNQQGDSVFVTRPGRAARETFEDVVQRCKNLCLKRPTMKELGITAPEVAEERFIARSTIFFGQYDVIIAQSAYHKKETIVGDAPETLARIIGNDPDPQKVRVVAGGELEHFRPKNAPVLSAEGKNNILEPKWTYWEV
jgi:hypothetical protein